MKKYRCTECDLEYKSFQAAANCHLGIGGVEEEDLFAKVPASLKMKATEGFVTLNPHQRGIDFDTFMEMVFECDGHLAIVGDVVIDDKVALRLAKHFAGLVGTGND